MDIKQTVLWLVPIVARGAAWMLAAKLGVDATEAESLGGGLAEALGALALVSVSIWTSLKGRKKLLLAEPPLIENV